jgi:hypothetical protein
MTAELKALPMCARCGRPVDRVVEELDDFTATVRFTAYCHGARETTRLSEEATRGVSSITMGTAFQGLRALPGVDRG